MSDSVRPHRGQPTRFLCPWDFPGKNTGLGYHFLLQGIFLNQGLNPQSSTLAGRFFTTEPPGKLSLLFSSVQWLSCVRLCDPMNHSTPGLPVHHQLPEFTQTHDYQVGDAIQPSHPLSPSSICLQSFPASGSLPISQFFASDGQSIGVSTSVLPMNIPG